MKDYEKARVAYETAAKSADLYLAPLQRMAEMYEELGDQQSQLRCLQKLDAISPLNVNRKVSLGEIHLAMGEPEKAEELFDKAMAQITKEPWTHQRPFSRIASIYADRDPAKAEKFLRNSLEVKGKYLSKGDIMLFNQLGISCASRAAGRTPSPNTNGPSRSRPKMKISIIMSAWPSLKAATFCRPRPIC
mgnify:CR=1 FL=1